MAETLEGTIKKEGDKLMMFDPTGQWREVSPTQTKEQIKLGATPPTGGIAEIGVPPALGVDTGNLLAQISGSLEQAKAQALQIQEGITKLKEHPITPAVPTEKKGIWETLMGKREEIQAPTLQTYQDVLAGFGFTPETLQKQQSLIGQLTEYQKQINAIEAEKTQRLLGAEQRMMGGLKSVLRGEQELIERQYNARIAAKSAEAGVVEMEYNLMRGMREEAFQMADIVMKYKMFEYDQKISDLNWIKDIYTEMTAEENREWEKQFKMAQFEADEAYRRERLNLDREAAVPGTLSSFTDVMQQVIDAGGTPEQAAREAAIASANMGVSVNQKQLTAWTEQARKMKMTPTPVQPTPKPITPIETGRYFPSALSETIEAPGKAVGQFWENLFGFVGGMFGK